MNPPTIPPTIPVYCINMKCRPDRRVHIEEQFRIMGLDPDRVIFPMIEKHPMGGIYGCFDSHMKVWSDFMERFPDEDLVLIFEDDSIAPPNAIKLINDAIDFYRTNREMVDMVTLHDICIRFNDPISTDIFVRGKGNTTHAMLVSRAYIQRIIDRNGGRMPEPTGEHFDSAVINSVNSDVYTNRVYYTRYRQFIQIQDQSDNANDIWRFASEWEGGIIRDNAKVFYTHIYNKLNISPTTHSLLTTYIYLPTGNNMNLFRQLFVKSK